MQLRKIVSVMTAAVMTAGVFSACSVPGADDGKLTVVTTIFPEYDWVMNVLGDNPAGAEVTMLVDNGVDIHSYQPSVSDITLIGTCDVFVYVGGESDQWVADALSQAVNKDMIVIDLMDVLSSSVVEEEVVEGMQADDEEESEGEEETEFDEHVWLSLRNAGVIVDAIADALSQADPDNADTYAANAASYNDELTALDARFTDAVAGGSTDTILFGDRFPFRYLTDDYGLNYYAAFAGCSAETEASFETITFLAQKVDELGLHAVLTIDGSDQRIAETIVSNASSSDVQILTMNSMQSVTSADAANGVTYLSAMEDNLNILTEALS
ncbi:MAG: metal ABC transporter substrate-binding protein [Saccharofermentans sp.]|nr:metal ABC transporter substrate-binding protein [Saccharofermentans sp.]